jgi:lysophospholipase L1-like esterase
VDVIQKGLGKTQVVNFAAPVLTGGTPPVAVSCNPASGSGFAPGATPVTCTATDAGSRQATCSFKVTINPLTLTATRFMAFGDSVTLGENGLSSLSAFWRTHVIVAQPYPAVLQGLLSDAFPSQTVTVINEGLGGERVRDSEPRMETAVINDRPDTMLLLDGYNDLLNEGVSGVDDVYQGLKTDIDVARLRGVHYIFLSELTPPLPGLQREIDPNAIIQANQAIDQLASDEGVVLVKPYQVFLGHETEYVADGLHLTQAGYQALAKVFYDSIVANLVSN